MCIAYSDKNRDFAPGKDNPKYDPRIGQTDTPVLPGFKPIPHYQESQCFPAIAREAMWPSERNKAVIWDKGNIGYGQNVGLFVIDDSPDL